ncbi:MAG TPA: undecaprenyl-diphosphate phosphatase [Steroidobacteraceae bacterium]|nr:undecaprenyl-diphosphate phosphatase [Steroidobacteraceae bacterium]
MDLVQAIVLAVVQGLSEFLPISSSGHLVLIPHFFGWPDQGLAFDVAVHLGTLAALLVYFRRQLWTMATAWLGSVTRQQHTRDSRLAWQLLVATIPVGLVGLLFNDFIEENLRNPLFVAGTLTFFGLLMYAADRWGRGDRDEFSLSWGQSFLIGCAQALALMPGTSRSGITMTAGRALGLSRSGAARFSFLLAIPGIGAAGAYEGLKLLTSDHPVDWLPMFVGLVFAALSGLACIHLLIRFIERIGLLPFTLYRLLIAAVIVWHFT